METLNGLAVETIPLAEQEFALLDARFKGDEYNTLVAWLRPPAEKASGLVENNRKWFSGWVEQSREELVTATVSATIDELRGVDGILLAEALAGSARERQLLELYVKEEAALTRLSMIYQTYGE